MKILYLKTEFNSFLSWLGISVQGPSWTVNDHTKGFSITVRVHPKRHMPELNFAKRNPWYWSCLGLFIPRGRHSWAKSPGTWLCEFFQVFRIQTITGGQYFQHVPHYLPCRCDSVLGKPVPTSLTLALGPHVAAWAWLQQGMDTTASQFVQHPGQDHCKLRLCNRGPGKLLLYLQGGWPWWKPAQGLWAQPVTRDRSLLPLRCSLWNVPCNLVDVCTCVSCRTVSEGTLVI